MYLSIGIIACAHGHTRKHTYMHSNTPTWPSHTGTPHCYTTGLSYIGTLDISCDVIVVNHVSHQVIVFE